MNLLQTPMFWTLLLLSASTIVRIQISNAQPLTKPYIAYLTSPFDQLPHIISPIIDDDTSTSTSTSTGGTNNNLFSVHKLMQKHGDGDQSCPPPINVRYDHGHNSMGRNEGGFGHGNTNGNGHGNAEGGGGISPPVIFPLYQNSKSIIYLHHHELLDAIHFHHDQSHESHASTSASTMKMFNFPLLFQGSTFAHNVSPLIHDVNGDTIEDAILVDYDGLITVIGLDTTTSDVDTIKNDKNGNGNGNEKSSEKKQRMNKKKRYYQEYQIPRLLLRKDWISLLLNETLQEELINADILQSQHENQDHHLDWFDSYFEYDNVNDFHYAAHGNGHQHEHQHRTGKIIDASAVRGFNGDILQQDFNMVQRIKNRDLEQGRRRLEEIDDLDSALNDNMEAEKQNLLKESSKVGGKEEVWKSETLGQNIDNTASNSLPKKEDNDFIERHNAKYYLDENETNSNDENNSDKSSNIKNDDDLTYKQEGFEEEPHNDYAYGYDNQYYPDYPVDDFYDSPYERSPQEQLRKKFHSDDNYIYLPPHVLSSPTYFEEVVKTSTKENVKQSTTQYHEYSISEYIALSVSYYFDEDEHTVSSSSSSFSGNHKKRDQKFSTDQVTNNDVDKESKRGLYVANALVIFDLQEKIFKSFHLDLSTDYSSPLPLKEEWENVNNNFGVGVDSTLEWHLEDYDGMGAFAIASPTVADVNGDGKMEALIGTSMGFVHCIQVPQGSQKFTIQMKNKIENPIVVENVLGDSNLEIFVMDMNTNMICLDHEGKTIWTKKLLRENEQSRGTSDFVLGDINGDGVIDIVVTVRISSQTNDGHIFRIYAMNAMDGFDLEGFPKDVDMPSSDSGKDSYDNLDLWLVPKPILVDLDPSDNLGMNIVQPLDLNIYIIQGKSGCVQVLSFRNQIASVTVDNVRGGDILSLILTTKAGDVQIVDFPTVDYHRLNSHPNPSDHVHGLSASSGFFIHKKSKSWRSILGDSVKVTFEIVQNKMQKDHSQEYWVDLRIGTSSKQIIFGKMYDEAGVYTEEIIFPFQPGYYIITARLRTKNGLVYQDEFQFSYNMNFFTEMLAWILMIPCTVTFIALLLRPEVDNTKDESAPFGFIGRST